eukprot:8220925-Alexandrium_andersonii.AAC.1
MRGLRCLSNARFQIGSLSSFLRRWPRYASCSSRRVTTSGSTPAVAKTSQLVTGVFPILMDP